jgi:hypothetical protein
MTCTHAALKRQEFINLAFQYDNLLMEEAAQILEIETFIPMLLQVGPAAGGRGRRGRACGPTRSPLPLLLSTPACIPWRQDQGWMRGAACCQLATAWQLLTQTPLHPPAPAPQRPDGAVPRLKRVILIGDHQQLPPVVKNMAFQKYRWGGAAAQAPRSGLPLARRPRRSCSCMRCRRWAAAGRRTQPSS